jgi:hypothetical protein
MGIRVVAVDIGSLGSSSESAWAVFDDPRCALIVNGIDPEAAVSALTPGLLAGGQVALLLEPVSVPVPDSQPVGVAQPGKGADWRGQQAMAGAIWHGRAGDEGGVGCTDAPSVRVHKARLATPTQPRTGQRGDARLLPGRGSGQFRVAHLQRALRAAGAIQSARGYGTVGRAGN